LLFGLVGVIDFLEILGGVDSDEDDDSVV
jgi:hypothetical protein